MMVVAKEKQHVVRSGLLEKEQIPKCELLKIQQNPPKCRLLSLLYVFSQDRSISKHRKSTVFFSLASFFPIFATSDDQGSK